MVFELHNFFWTKKPQCMYLKAYNFVHNSAVEIRGPKTSSSYTNLCVSWLKVVLVTEMARILPLYCLFLCIKKAGSESKVVGKKSRADLKSWIWHSTHFAKIETIQHILQQIPVRIELICQAFRNTFDVINILTFNYRKSTGKKK